jgi:hypothetical protein
MIWFGLLLLVLLCAGVVVALRLPPGATLLPLALLCTDCGPTAHQVQAVAADTAAAAANMSLSMLVAIERTEERAAIAKAATDVQEQWAPIWKTWDDYDVAHSAYRTALRQGTATPALEAEARLAYCALRAVLVGRAELPDHPLRPCEGPP